MCVKPGEKVVPVRCRPRTYPCPTCGRRGRRKRLLERYVRSLAYQQVAWLRVLYAEYKARCCCRKYFRSCPPDICPRADFDNLVRTAVLDRVLDDGLNVERTLAAMSRDFRLELSVGFVYDCLDWGLSRLNGPQQRRTALRHFCGTLCIDELHLGEYTLLLCTDPIADRVLGYRLVRVNDAAHMACFLRALRHAGFSPKVVVTDGSALYPKALAEVWPAARHQLCVFHVLMDVNAKVLDALRRLRRAKARRGKAGRRRKRGRPTKAQRSRRQRRGPTAKEKASFVYKRRFLVVKKAERLSKAEWSDLVRMFEYLPQLRPLWHFSQEVYKVFSAEQAASLARRRRTLLLKKASYQEVPELAEAMGMLAGDKFDKMIAFLERPAGERVRTNNHVERTNRKLRFDEKVRYKWRSGRSLETFLALRIARINAAARPTPAAPQSTPEPTTLPHRPALTGVA